MLPSSGYFITQTMEVEPIGFLRTCFHGKFGIPRQPGLCPSAWGVLEFTEKYRSPEAVRGLEGFSHVWLIFGFHGTEKQGWHPTVRPPRLGGNERVGVFASRSTFRPNGLGLSLVKLDRIEANDSAEFRAPAIHVSGVDLMDGTPIFDVKPYLPYAEAIPEAESGYAGEPIERLAVEIETAARASFEKADDRSRQIIKEVLSIDPRPAASAKAPDKTHGMELCGLNVRFRIDKGICYVSEVSPLAHSS
jgi:tRNA-Thr(GGU) m(6)t(6)A37 methyltransferase TsaA